MKNSTSIILVLCTCYLVPMTANAQSTAFNYSGQLNFEGAPANGYFDFIFTLLAANPLPDPEVGGLPPWPGELPFALHRVAVSNGLFTVTLDYGPIPFDGADLLLAIQVRTNAPAGGMEDPPPPPPPFSALTPHQRIATVPYAIRALNAGSAFTVTGPVPDGSIPSTVARLAAPSQTLSGKIRLPNPGNDIVGSFSGNGRGLRNIQFGSLDFGGALSLTAPTFNTLNTDFVPAYFFQVADFNRDGIPDIANVGNGSVMIATNDKAGHFLPGTTFPLPQEFAIVDLNADGFMDIVAGRRCFTNMPGLAFSSGEISGVAGPILGPDSLFADLNADGDIDVIQAGGGTSLNYRDGLLLDPVIVAGVTNWTRTAPGFPGSCSPPIVVCGPALADVNGDGLPDLLAQRCGSQAISILTNRNAGFGCPWLSSTSSLQTVLIPGGFYEFRAGDFNRDGLGDILVAQRMAYASNVLVLGGSLFTNYFFHVTLSLHLNQGSSGFVQTWTSSPLTNLAAFDIADLNRDGSPDVAILQWTEAGAPPEVPRITGIRSLLSDGVGGFVTAAFSTIATASLPGPGRFVLADENGDGTVDVVIGNWGIAYAAPTGLSFRAGAVFGATSGPPFSLSSTSRVDNLNVDLLDGFDSGAFVLKSGDTMLGPLAAPSFTGDGSALTALNASQLSSGTVSDTRLSGNVARRGSSNLFTADNTFAAATTFNGSNTFTAPNTFTASNIFTAGNRFNAPNTFNSSNTFTAGNRFDAANAFQGSNTFSGVVSAINPLNQFAGNGVGLINLSADNLVGTIPGPRIAGTYPNPVILGNSQNFFTGTFMGDGSSLVNLPGSQISGPLPAGALAGTYGNPIALSNPQNTLAGNGSALTALNASSVNSGTLADGRLSANVSLLDASQTVSGTKNFAPPAGAPFTVGRSNRVQNLNADMLDGLDSSEFVFKSGDTLSGPLTATAFLGDGSGLTGLNAANVTTGVLPLARGGSGASTAVNARANFGAAGRGANTDITSLSGLTTALSVAQGGTGAGIPATALLNLGGAALSGLNYFSGINQLTNTANVLAGNGSAITALSPSALAGPVPAARGGLGFDSSGVAPGSLLRTTGSGIWGPLPPGGEGQMLKLISGTPAWANVDYNVAGDGLLLNGLVFSVSFAGSGVATTVAHSDHTHDASSLVSGTLSSARLSGTYSSAVTLNNVANSFTGLGSGLTSLNASQLSSGTIPDTRMSPNVAFLNLSQTFSGTPNFNGGISGSTPPFTVDSSTVVTALNADLLDGLHSTAFSLATHNHDSAYWSQSGNAGTTPGATFLGTTDNQPLEFKVNGLRALRLEPAASDSINVIGGWRVNQVAPGVVGATIAGGGAGNFSGLGGPVTNRVLANFGTVSGGGHNAVYAHMGTIGGGEANIVSNNWCVIAGGYHNAAMATSVSILGGESNTGTGGSATIAGGGANHAAGPYSSIGGGHQNIATGAYAMIPGGADNVATNLAFAAGHFARATNTGSFVWADSTVALLTSTNNDSVTMRASGGYRLFTDTSPVAGVRLAAGGGSWTSMSDRNAKENFAEVSCREVLEKVTALPLNTWNYKSQDAAIRHIGPMAQDFKSAFGVGESDTGITSVDADGVALAAIQGLNQKLEERLNAKEAEIVALKRSIDELRALVLKGGVGR